LLAIGTKLAGDLWEAASHPWMLFAQVDPTARGPYLLTIYLEIIWDRDHSARLHVADDTNACAGL